MIVDITYDNYFGKEGIFKWYKSTAQKLTPAVLAKIKEDPHIFFYCESHFVDEDFYTPLAKRGDI